MICGECSVLQMCVANSKIVLGLYNVQYILYILHEVFILTAPWQRSYSNGCFVIIVGYFGDTGKSHDK